MDVATVGGFVLSAFLQVLFDRVASPAVLDFFRAKKLDVGLLRDLKITLLAADMVLEDAEERQSADNRVKMWLEELQDAVYDAEDLLDVVNTEAKSKLEKESQPKKTKSKLKLRARNIFKCLHSSDGDKETQLKEILLRLEKIVKHKDVLGLKERVGVEEMQNKRLPTTSLVEEDSVYGRNDEKESILKLLLDEHSSDSPGVITIKGMGGIGKTTLAQLVYNDDKIVKHFAFKAWVCISEEFDVFKVTKMILEAVTSSPSTTKNPNLLQVELKDKLADKKFLLVLDDIWNEDQNLWEMFRRPLNHGARGSKILVTTRNEGVARIMRTVPTYDLEKLSEEDCWKLFAKYAFEGGESGAHPDIEEVGREIVKRCEGLPLAAKALGGILRYKATTEEWILVKESNWWDLKDANCNILPVLRVSYHYLPLGLKRCFAFSSVFPKDYEFDKDELILLWAAQSFLPEKEGGKNMIEIGADYFDELISRSFFKRSNADKNYFVMHDLIHDLATFVSGQSCGCMNRDGAQVVAKKTRHMSYFRMRLEQFDNLPVENHLRTLVQLELDKTNRSRVPHTFYRYSEKVPNNLLTKFKLLRVLSLCEYDIWELPDSIGSLKHLRYLDLSKTNISRLDSICDLYNLQTLILRSVWQLTKLPKNICKLVNLLYLDITGCLFLEKMPRNLDKLRSLTRLKLECDGASIRELGPLWNLHGECRINSLQNVVSSADAAKAGLNDKKYIETLMLSWDSELHGPRKEYEVLENLQPHKNLKELTIENYGDARLPNWIGSRLYSNIVDINLEKCKFCQSIPTLGQLISLKELRICGFDGLQKLDSEFYGSSLAAKPFGSLLYLEIENMPQWEEWFHCDGEVFPLLQQLWIENCPKLRRNLPPHMPSLMTLGVHKCPQLAVSLPMAPALSYLYLCSSNEMLLNDFPEGLQQLQIEQYEQLESLPEGLTQISKSLQTMTRCSSSTSLPQAVSLSTLKSLEIKCCRKVEMRSDREYASLENLTISESCDSLQSFPLQCFPKLKALAISGCKNLVSFSLPNGAGPEFPSLTQLEIVNCSSFQNFPNEGLPFPNLRVFTFKDNEKAMRLPKQMLSLQCLEHLTVTSCSGIESLPEGGFPSSLTSLDISDCDRFVAELLDWGLHGLKSLLQLRLSGFQGLSSFPAKGMLPETIRVLIIEGFSDLEMLENIASLESLTVTQCPKLKSISPDRLPDSMTSLYIEGCPLLTGRLERDKGEDWEKISHIPHIINQWGAVLI